MKNPKLEKNYSANTALPSMIRLTVPPHCAGQRLDQALAGLLHQFSRTRLTAWIRDARVTVDGEPAQPRDKVWGGETIAVQPTPDPQELAFAPEAIPLNILFEDDTLLVVNKPPGLVVHPGSGNWQGTLLNALLQHAPALREVPRAGIVHRLDKDTSGLLVVAKTLISQTALVRQLQARTVTREYVAIAHGQITRGGRVEAPIGRHPVHRTRMAVVARGKAALTHYEVLERYARATLLRCRLETGRTHQIRVHLASIGHPLLGDPVYGLRGAGRVPFHRQALHAERLSLVHPVSGQQLDWHAPLPSDMEQLIATLRAQA
jgi:23S rRNA pseudouridine1911/1915/1917 synthase